MPERIWKGGATAVAQVNSETPANVEVGDVFGITLTDYQGFSDNISFTATDVTVANVTAGLAAAAAAAKAAGAYAWKDVTGSDQTTYFRITGDTSGNPFYVATTATNGGAADTQTLIDANTTACAGPSIFSQAENWISGTAPVDGDIITIPANAANDIYGYDATVGTTVQFAGFAKEPGCTIDIGAPNKALHVDLETDPGVTYNSADIAGTGVCYLQIDNYANVNITEAGYGAALGQYGLNLTGSLDDDAQCLGYVNIATSTGSVSIAANAGETMSVNAVNVSDGEVTVGSDAAKALTGATLDLTMQGGTVVWRPTAGTITKTSGTLTIEEDATVTVALNEDGGTTYYNSTGTATLVYIGDGGIVDCGQTLHSRTFTALEMYPGASYLDPLRKTTLTDGVNLHRCRIEDVTLNLGTHIKLSVAAVS